MHGSERSVVRDNSRSTTGMVGAYAREALDSVTAAVRGEPPAYSVN